jgi:hypothetical protein
MRILKLAQMSDSMWRDSDQWAGGHKIHDIIPSSDYFDNDRGSLSESIYKGKGDQFDQMPSTLSAREMEFSMYNEIKDSLSKKQRAVADLALGFVPPYSMRTNEQIAYELYISVDEVKAIKKYVLGKINRHNKGKAASSFDEFIKLAGTIGEAKCQGCGNYGNKNSRCRCGRWITGKPISSWKGSWAQQEEERKSKKSDSLWNLPRFAEVIPMSNPATCPGCGSSVKDKHNPNCTSCGTSIRSVVSPYYGAGARHEDKPRSTSKGPAFCPSCNHPVKNRINPRCMNCGGSVRDVVAPYFGKWIDHKDLQAEKTASVSKVAKQKVYEPFKDLVVSFIQKGIEDYQDLEKAGVIVKGEISPDFVWPTNGHGVLGYETKEDIEELIAWLTEGGIDADATLMLDPDETKTVVDKRLKDLGLQRREPKTPTATVGEAPTGVIPMTPPKKATPLLDAARERLRMKGILPDEKVAHSLWQMQRFAQNEQELIKLSDDGKFTYIVEGNRVAVIRYSGYDAQVVIPGEFDKLPVVSIGENAFQNNTSITSVKIPPSVKRIGDKAFAGCINLTDCEIPAGVSDIGVGAFEGCPIRRR